MFAYAPIAASAVVALAAAALAWAQAMRVVGASTVDVAKLAAQLKRAPLPDRPARLAEIAPDGSWERALAVELVEAPNDAARAVTANDALGDLARDLEAGAGWPSAALRIGGLGCVLVAVVTFLVYRDALAALPTLIPGFVGAAACVEAGRRAKAAAKARRRAVDELIDALMGPAAREQALESNARRRRRRDFV
jgi:hypothetical protein